MKRSYIVLIAVTIFIVAGVFVARSRAHVRLTVLVNGSPAANLTVTDFQSMTPRTLDASGSIVYDRDASKQNAIFLPSRNGGQQMIPLPKQGHTTIDLRSRLITSRTVIYDLGFFQHVESSEQYDLTDSEIAAISAGEVTLAEVQKLIRKEAEQMKD
jgi:hypothetical protein